MAGRHRGGVERGLGVARRVGLRGDETWNKRRGGKSGADAIKKVDASGRQVWFACEVKSCEPLQ